MDGGKILAGLIVASIVIAGLIAEFYTGLIRTAPRPPKTDQPAPDADAAAPAAPQAAAAVRNDEMDRLMASAGSDPAATKGKEAKADSKGAAPKPRSFCFTTSASAR